MYEASTRYVQSVPVDSVPVPGTYGTYQMSTEFSQINPLELASFAEAKPTRPIECLQNGSSNGVKMQKHFLLDLICFIPSHSLETEACKPKKILPLIQIENTHH